MNHVHKEQRMLKCGLMECYRLFPAAIHAPVYQLTDGMNEEPDPNQFALACRLISGLNRFPWPQRHCILILYNTAARNCSRLNRMSICYFRGKTYDIQELRSALSNEWQDSELSEFQSFIHIEVEWNELINEPRIRHADSVRIGRLHTPLLQAEQLAHFDLLSVPIYAPLLRQLTTTNGIWISRAFMLEEDELSTSSLAYLVMAAIGTYTWMGGLLPLIEPVGYLAKGHFREGFGPPSMRRKVAGVDVFRQIPHNRLYTVPPTGSNESTGTREGHTRRAHARREHTRRLWYKRGIDRHTLPTDWVERVQLAENHNVPAITIPPVWVGDPTYADETFIGQIVLTARERDKWYQTSESPDDAQD